MPAIPLWLEAALWGLLSGSALLLGAVLAYFFKVPKKVIGSVMAFGSGVLISALSFDLMDEAYERGGFDAAATGFISGAFIYTLANFLLARSGARHRKRSGSQQPSEKEDGGSGLAIAIGSLMDGIPESIAIGVSMIEGSAVSIATVIAIFLSNVPESLSSTSGMKKSGRSAGYIFSIWCGIAIMSALASLCGYTIFRDLSPDIIAATIAVAAGGILTMVADTMIPEAFEEGHGLTGMICAAGFLSAFVLTKLV
ncbi:MAG TPA: hypothetical protein VGB50_00125 [Flavobacterium sp.]|jgi:ZIP family zinc transporter